MSQDGRLWLPPKGFLQKLGSNTFVNRFRRRWFSLKGTNLCYYKDAAETEQKGFIDLSLALSIQPVPGNLGLRYEKRDGCGWVFQINTPSRIYYLVAASEADMAYWVEGLKKVVAEITAAKERERREATVKADNALKKHMDDLEEQLETEREKVRQLTFKLSRATERLQFGQEELQQLREELYRRNTLLEVLLATPLAAKLGDSLQEMKQWFDKEREIQYLRLRLKAAEEELTKLNASLTTPPPSDTQSQVTDSLTAERAQLEAMRVELKEKLNTIQVLSEALRTRGNALLEDEMKAQVKELLDKLVAMQQTALQHLSAFQHLSEQLRSAQLSYMAPQLDVSLSRPADAVQDEAAVLNFFGITTPYDSSKRSVEVSLDELKRIHAKLFTVVERLQNRWQTGPTDQEVKSDQLEADFPKPNTIAIPSDVIAQLQRSITSVLGKLEQVESEQTKSLRQELAFISGVLDSVMPSH